jgi:hypothetical protein
MLQVQRTYPCLKEDVGFFSNKVLCSIRSAERYIMLPTRSSYCHLLPQFTSRDLGESKISIAIFGRTLRKPTERSRVRRQLGDRPCRMVQLRSRPTKPAI